MGSPPVLPHLLQGGAVVLGSAPVLCRWLPVQRCSHVPSHFTGKDPSVNLEALEEFKNFSQHKGLLQESIVVPEQQEECVSEHYSDAPQNCISRASSAPTTQQ
ncbi:vomeronasal secretory protein 2-like [Nannospalax galili]|uniref:vomeronasal secretory protein 2-like n=1 Tax=Nannospalax galili TaxID=1026970 RepID=UPI00111C76C2|nr:vomeronasal secretory protein 2-like [Nannospalax galili]